MYLGWGKLFVFACNGQCAQRVATLPALTKLPKYSLIMLNPFHSPPAPTGSLFVLGNPPLARSLFILGGVARLPLCGQQLALVLHGSVVLSSSFPSVPPCCSQGASRLKCLTHFNIPRIAWQDDNQIIDQSIFIYYSTEIAGVH